MSDLLAFHTTVLDKICGEDTNDLLVLARGLGLRRIICTLLKIYESPSRLILLINSSGEDEVSQIGDELGIMGVRRNPGFRVVTYETPTKDRKQLYAQGGLISVTSRILVVDMLQGDIPIHLISGVLVLHAERVNALSLESFIVRLYREKNEQGFLKAFTDEPERIANGLTPLKNIMKELRLRQVHLYPRFQDDVKASLERRKADVIELSQNLTEPMAQIHAAIIQCMSATLSELKKSNKFLDLDELNLENAYFRHFDMVVRRQLDSVWHKVGPRTKQLVSDLKNLRTLLGFLLSYDCFEFLTFCETLIAAESSSSTTGAAKQHPPAWLLTDSANIIFKLAKERCYTTQALGSREDSLVVDLTNESSLPTAGQSSGNYYGHPSWIPDHILPTCDELPKWDLLHDVLLEIESEIIRLETTRVRQRTPGNNTILIMTSTNRSASLILEFLSSIDPDAPPGRKGHRMMLRKLRRYLWWKKHLTANERSTKTRTIMHPEGNTDQPTPSDALRKKDEMRASREKNRRRVRGGAPPVVSKSASNHGSLSHDIAGRLSQDDLGPSLRNFDSTLNSRDDGTSLEPQPLAGSAQLENEESMLFEDFYGLIPSDECIVVRTYAEDGDDMLLQQLEPTFIVMMEPSIDFIRRIEVFKATHEGYGVRVYHLTYGGSAEEHQFLAGVRKEKEAFERLIKEKATMLLTLEEKKRDSNDDIIRTINTRIAGGRKEASHGPLQIVVDMREFRSTLPSLIHAASVLVIPATLTVGDYILSPDICVERKSLADLVSSFNSGRLYAQCELMSAHYKYPILLIEFEEDKAFSLDVISDTSSYAKPANTFGKRSDGGSSGFSPTIQSKLVLLTLHFPRLKIIWSSSPYASADIFKDLKRLNPEPDPKKAVAIGVEEDGISGGVNAAAEELLRSLPGISTKNIRYVSSKVKSVKEFCNLSLDEVQKMLGNEPGKQCWEFMHRGDR